MSATIDESSRQSFDPLALLRPVPGAAGAAGPPPDSVDAPKTQGGNAFIWLASTREKALILEEIDAGLRDESDRAADAEPPARLWERIFNVSQQYLHDHGKDIRIAFFCLEAWIRRDGLAGLASGLELLRGLIAAYWETLHPLPADGADDDRRIDCLVEYYATRDDVALEYSPLFFALNRHVSVAADGKNLSPEVARQWLAACRRAVENCDALEKLAASPEFSQGGVPFPTPGKLRRRLEEVEAVLLALHPRDADASTAEGGEGEVAFEAEAQPGSQRKSAAGFPDLGRLIAYIASNRRGENIQILRILGRRFQDTEPHSPVGYAIAHWASMAEKPLPELLDKIGILNESERSNLKVFAGVRAPDNKQ